MINIETTDEQKLCLLFFRRRMRECLTIII